MGDSAWVMRGWPWRGALFRALQVWLAWRASEQSWQRSWMPAPGSLDDKRDAAPGCRVKATLAIMSPPLQVRLLVMLLWIAAARLATSGAARDMAGVDVTAPNRPPILWPQTSHRNTPTLETGTPTAVPGPG